jgi:hypothetical protein
MTRAATVSANPHNLARQLKGGGLKEVWAFSSAFAPPCCLTLLGYCVRPPPRPIILG